MLGDNNVKHQRNIWMEQSFEFKGFWTYTMKSFSWKATNWGEGFSIEWEDLANCLHLSHFIWKNFMINIIIHGEQCQNHRYFENRYLRGIPDFLLWHIQALGNTLKIIKENHVRRWDSISFMLDQQISPSKLNSLVYWHWKAITKLNQCGHINGLPKQVVAAIRQEVPWRRRTKKLLLSPWKTVPSESNEGAINFL